MGMHIKYAYPWRLSTSSTQPSACYFLCSVKHRQCDWNSSISPLTRTEPRSWRQTHCGVIYSWARPYLFSERTDDEKCRWWVCELLGLLLRAEICKYIADACILMPGRRLIYHISTRWGHALFSNCSFGRKQRCRVVRHVLAACKLR